VFLICVYFGGFTRKSDIFKITVGLGQVILKTPLLRALNRQSKNGNTIKAKYMAAIV